MMKVILTSEPNAIKITRVSAKIMTALTNGGLGQLPGDAVTADLDTEAQRIEASRSMPKKRAIENMIRSGHDPDFAGRWIGSLLAGGETTATAFGMVKNKTFPSGGDHAAIGENTVPTGRFFRDAWRSTGGKVYVDLDAAKKVFAARVLRAKGEFAKKHLESVELSQLLGDQAPLEAQYEALKSFDLRALGVQIMRAMSARELVSLWPSWLPIEQDFTTK